MGRKTEGVDGLRRLVFVVIVLIMLVVALRGYGYEPMTEEEAEAYLERDPAGAIADIIALDAIEHAIPKILMPETLTILKNGTDLVIHHEPGYLEFTIEPYLDYRILLEGKTIKGFAPRPRVLPSMLAIVGGCAAAVLTEVLLTETDPGLREGISIGVGSLTGLALLFLLR